MTVGETPVDGILAGNARTESAASWARLVVCVLLGTIGGVGLWSVVVVLPTVQTAFGASRADASMAYTLAMLGFAFGGVATGRLADRLGLMPTAIGGACLLGVGFLGAAASPSLRCFVLSEAVVGIGASATFGPVVADIAHWFDRRRGLAMAIATSGNYLAGTLWPPVVQHLVAGLGWRGAHVGIGVFCVLGMVPLALLLRRRGRPPVSVQPVGMGRTSLGLSPGTVQAALIVAGFACCTAMAMPQVHIVAYCGDLGYGPARGAQMLSVMLGFGIVSRVASGWVADRIGGLATLLIGSVMQMAALLLYAGFDSLTSLYLISIVFGLFQGGIVPSYAIIVRAVFPPQETGLRFGLVLMATILGMAAGGWMSGAIFDLTGSYRAAFVNGVAWNVLNAAIALWLLLCGRMPGPRFVIASGHAGAS
jgi:MFS family permease